MSKFKYGKCCQDMGGQLCNHRAIQRRDENTNRYFCPQHLNPDHPRPYLARRKKYDPKYLLPTIKVQKIFHRNLRIEANS